MPDYKEMYLDMVREAEKAINILIAVQQKCEAQYIEADDLKVVRCSVPKTNEKRDGV